MRDTAGPRTAGDGDVAAHVARIATEGYTILEGVVPDDLRRDLAAAVDRVEAAEDTPFGTNAFLGERTRRVFNLLGRDPGFGCVPLFAPVLRLAEQVLDDGLLLSSLTAIDMHPGQAAQPFHADDGSIPLPRPHLPLTCVAIWALTDFTPDNGATRLVPGSHRAERRPRSGEQPDGAVEAVMPAGSVLVYNGSLWHGGGPNRSGAPRRGIVCNYCAGWVRQEEGQPLALTRAQVAAFPPRLRRMVGYGVYKGLIGHVDQIDPGSWFPDGETTGMIWDRMR